MAYGPDNYQAMPLASIHHKMPQDATEDAVRKASERKSEQRRDSDKKLTETHHVTIDLRKEQGGKIYCGLPEGKKPDVTMKMSQDTFDALCDKKLSGFRGFCTGKIKINGQIKHLTKFDKEFVGKYLHTTRVDMSEIDKIVK